MSVEIVAQAKADLIAAGKDLSGNDGAFLIVMEAASRIPGAGVLDKPSGNHAVFDGQSYAVDIIAFADGRIVDCLIDGGGANTPSWDTTKAPVDPSRFRPAVAILGAPPIVVPPVDPGIPVPSLDFIATRIDDLEDALSRIEGAIADLARRPDPVITVPPVTIPPVVFPNYSGKVSIPFVGDRTITLKPEGQ